MRNIYLSLMIVLSTTSAAQDELKGQWKLIKAECSSGAPYLTFGSKHLEGSSEVTATFTVDQLTIVAVSNVKYEPTYGAEKGKEVEDAIEMLQASPNGVSKSESLAQAKAQILMIDKFSKGLTCTLKESMLYSLNGSSIHTAAPLSHSSDCPGDTGSSDSKNDDSIFELHGKTLKVTGPIEESEESTCPQGDQAITTFERVLP